jgi:hypothetical protein
MFRKITVVFLFCLFAIRAFPQTGGDNVYEFLNLTHSGLVSSLGGMNVSLPENNLNLSYHNPALLRSGMDRSLALNYVNYFAGINYGLAMYARSFPGKGNFAAGITYLNYGSFTEADASGTITGDFKAAEYAFSFLYSRQFDSLFSVGISLKPILSNLEKYNSFGLALDLGASYHSSNNNFSAGVVLRNAGLQITTYAGENRQKLPFEIQAGLSQRLNYAPLRFSLTLRHLEKFDLTHEYYKSGTTETNNRTTPEFADNLLRHVIIGTELIPHKNFYLSAGFNFQRRKEMQSETDASMAGFSWGFGIITTWMNIELGRAVYHVAGSSTNISLILRPDEIYKRSR